jgi:hypothetical protein
MAVEIIQGTDRQFSLRIVKKSNDEPKDLTGLTGTALTLKMPKDDGTLDLTLTPNANGSKLELASALGGKILVTLSDVDTALLKSGDGQSMELTIKEGAGPDFDISIVQFANSISIKKSLFETT